MKYWLVTWESASDQDVNSRHIATILNGRMSDRRVCDIVEQLYANTYYSLAERLVCARNRKHNPYPAYYNTVDGVPLAWDIYCGHNPWLHARLVDNLRVIRDDRGEERLVWDELPKPRMVSAASVSEREGDS